MLHEIFYILLTVTLYIIACFVVARLSTRVGIEPTEASKFSSSLEVLRGFAAFLVFGAHSTMYFGYASKQVIAASMGEVGVLLFFMLTGHLFWSQIRENRYNAITFFKKRIYRLAPIMFLFISIVMLLDWATSGFPIPTTTQWLALFRNYGFGFGTVVNSIGNVNDVFSQDMYLRINNIWTLRWEWLFYLVIPILATLNRFSGATLFAVALVLLFMDPFQLLTGTTDIVFIMAFWFGGLSYELERNRDKYFKWLFSKAGSNIMLLLSVVALFTYLLYGGLVQKNVRYPAMIFLVFPIFLYFVISKSHLNRLTWTPLQLMGKVSYSFYLWHLAVNFYVMRIMSRWFHHPQSVGAFVAICLMMMLVSVTISVITYRFIEEPFLKKSHIKK